MENSQPNITTKQYFLVITYNAIKKFAFPLFIVSPFAVGLYAVSRVRKWKYKNPSIFHRIPFYMLAASLGYIGTFLVGIGGLNFAASIIEYIDIEHPEIKVLS